MKSKFLTLIFLLILPCLLYSAHKEGHKGLNKITVQLKWTHQFQFAGFYAAIEQGFYEEAGLDIRLVEYQPGTNIVQQVISGNANFGVHTPSLLIDRDAGKKVVLLAPIYQHSPLILITRKDANILSPHDLSGKTIMNSPHSYEINAMLSSEGVQKSNYTQLLRTYDYRQLTSPEIDAFDAYITTEPYNLSRLSYQYHILKPINYGIDFYGDCIFTSVKEIRLHPHRTKDFLSATLKGWQYALDHQEEIIDLIIQKYNPNISREALRSEALQVYDLMLPKYIELGHNNPGRWKQIVSTFQKLGYVSTDFQLDPFLYNPEPKIDIRKALILSSLIFGFLLIVIGILYIFNRRLNIEVENRTKQLMRSEAKAREILNNHTQLSGILTPEGKLSYINQAALNLIGASEEELLGKYFWDTPWWTHSPRLQDQLRTACSVAANGGFLEFEATHLDTTGREHIIAFSIKAITDDKGNVTELLPEGKDITSFRETQEKLQQAQKMEAIGTMAGGIAHDLNNILAAIFGNADLLKMNLKEGSENMELMDQIILAAERAKQLITQILTFSRKNKESDKKIFSLAKTVKESIDFLRATIPSSIHIHSKLLSEDSILADPVKVNQVLMNLCTNAYHAMEGTKGSLNLQLDTMELDGKGTIPDITLTAGKYLVLSISDTGCGIAPQNLEKIFDPFFTTKKQGQGTGLGLSVVHGIMKELNGQITVYSELNKGTTFKLYFPVAKLQMTDPVKLKHSEIKSGQGRHILLVDDEPSITQVIQMALRKYDYQVSSFNDSLKAIQFFKENSDNLDLVISDMTMPDLSGIDLARQIVAHCPGFPIILSSGYHSSFHESIKDPPPISLYLKKPLAIKDLLVAVSQVLGL